MKNDEHVQMPPMAESVLAKRDLYREAVTEGLAEYRRQTNKPETIIPKPVMGPTGPGYWIARHAAREAVDALLIKARALGLPEDQWEALRVVAAEVAYD